MPDISMCKGGSCPRKQDCYRYRAIPTSQRQAYFARPPVQTDGSCGHFAELRIGDHLSTPSWWERLWNRLRSRSPLPAARLLEHRLDPMELP
jgi:hypothetical protein